MSGRMKTICVAVAFLLAAGMSQASYAQEDTVVLDNLTQYYAAVEFDHVMHVDLLGSNSCATCHHHTVGTPLVDETCKRCHAANWEADSAACRECHPMKPFSAEYLEEVASNIHLYHKDKPGLKGAFHQPCLGCHIEMEHLRTVRSAMPGRKTGTSSSVPASSRLRSRRARPGTSDPGPQQIIHS